MTPMSVPHDEAVAVTLQRHVDRARAVLDQAKVNVERRAGGGRLLIIRPVEETQPPSIRLTLHWFDELRRLTSSR
jgi:hypothetical protein